MANNIQLSANIGTGQVAASDDVAGVQYQRVKLTDGTEDGTTVIAAGGGAEANALRVTIASDSTGVVSVDDNGGSLTVDAPVGTPAFVRLSDGTAAITTLPVSLASVPTHPVTNAGTFPVQATQAGTWTIDLGPTDNAVLDAIAASVASTLIVGLPSGASTAAKQPAIGTAGTASADVLTIQGIASMTALLVNGSGVTQPVSGTVTANAGTGTMAVSLASVPAHAVTNAGTFATQATLQAGSAAIGKLTVNTGVTIGAVEIAAAQTLATVTTVTTVAAVTAITNALPAGTNAIGKLAANTGVDIGDVDVLSIAAGTNLIGDVGIQPRTTGGLTMSKTTSAATTNATSLKASAGQVYAIQCFSVNAAVRYLKLYNKASAPTVGTDVPVKTIAIPGNAAGAGVVLAWPHGLAFATGIAFALTTEATDAGTTGVAVSEITVNIDYK